jgi:ribosomal-protein-alanine N-acetyltransferase
MGVAVTELRAMSFEDVVEVADLELAHRIRPWSEAVIRDEISQPNRSYVVALDDGIVGYGGLMIVGDEAHITNLLVAPDHRGRGLGRSLMSWLIRAAVTGGAQHMTLEVRRSSHVARSLYVSMGFTHEGVRPEYYGDDDALIMWARDIDQPAYLEGIA